MEKSHDLERFTAAQAGIYDRVRTELASGQKKTHWMWFIFPQIAGLGRSEMSRLYAIASLEEAQAYLRHPVLGARLRECVGLVSGLRGCTAHQILGSPDDQKFRSSLTLFWLASDREAVFDSALHRYFDGLPDPETISRL